jgi:hypothetical protein
VGGYALFAGGRDTTSSTSALGTVDAYDSSLTQSTITDLSLGRYCLAATTIGNHAILAAVEATTIGQALMLMTNL